MGELMAGRGAPKGHKYGVTHGLALVRNEIKRRVKRGRSYVDKRTHDWQDALRIQAGLVEDQGGIENISTARFVAIQELSQLYYLGRDDGPQHSEVPARKSEGQERAGAGESVFLPHAGHEHDSKILSRVWELTSCRRQPNRWKRFSPRMIRVMAKAMARAMISRVSEPR